jgi:uncharacterized membrane protein (UPF0127 family)
VKRARILNTTSGRLLAQSAEVADSFWSRMRGLLGHAPLTQGEGMLIMPCQWIHTLFMSFSIDVVYLSDDLRVVHLQEDVSPNRLCSPVSRASCVVELPPGAISRTGVEVDDQLELRMDGETVASHP